MTGNGIVCATREGRVALDPRRADAGASLNFVSHAHADHLPAKRRAASAASCRILASGETRSIAGLRGVDMGSGPDGADGFTLVDSGHILGARGLLIGGEVFYTGDICTRSRGFLRAARVPRCRTLITECTFGLPEFEFPVVGEVVSRVNAIISGLYSAGRPAVLMGYELGKAQTLSDLFGHWDPLVYHDSVKRMNDMHRSLGVPLRDAPGHSEAEASGLLASGPWVMVAPMLPARSRFVREMKSRYGAVTVGFSGWAAGRSRFPLGRRCDHSVPLSDHCDFAELVRMVSRSGAETVYTTHGFADEFASHLGSMGIDARPLRAGALESFS